MRKHLGVLLLAICALFTMFSCKNFSFNRDNYDTANDSAMIAEYVNSVTNPQLADVNEALSLKQSMIEKLDIDSAFLKMPDNTITNVVSVLSKEHPVFYKEDIVKEYRRCRQVYDNLPKENATNVDLAATDLGTRPDKQIRDSVIRTTYNYRTDTINGKPVKVQIKTVESYE